MDEASSGSGQLGPVSQTVPEHMSRLRKPENPFLYSNSSPEMIRLVVMIYVRHSNRTRAGPNLKMKADRPNLTQFQSFEVAAQWS